MKRTFVEVIMNIKDGETWENEVKSIERIGGRIDITTKGVSSLRTMCFGNHKSYSLVVESVSFTEAFKAYEEGKRIKSLVTEYEYIKTKKEDAFYNLLLEAWSKNTSFELEEIRGQWQILD